MSDDLANRGQQDRSRINMTEDHEVRYWTQRLGVDREMLATAITEVGPSVTAVERYLRQTAKGEN